MGRPHILVIDNEPDLQHVMAATLRINGHDGQPASDGRKGLALIGRHPLDLIFCDLRMPERDGQAFYSEIRRDYPQALKPIGTR